MTLVADGGPGDSLGLDIPSHPDALLAAGPNFLTDAFHATGALGLDNRVARIARHEEWRVGSTGRKLLLSVAYAKEAPDLHRDLFVKFSRDFDDESRDRGRIQMDLETRFALLSTRPDFPIAVPKCYFADYQRASGTGLLVTERIPFGNGRIEPHYEKCLDYLLPNALEHYEAILRSIARLAGTHKSGHGLVLTDEFASDPAKLAVRPQRPHTAEQLRRKADSFRKFAATYPNLLPPGVTESDFVDCFTRDILLFANHEREFQDRLRANSDLMALSHWNANIDNAWFWRNGDGELECGLLDWGNVCEMNIAASLWGSLSGAEPELWNLHLDSLLATFTAEFERSGGPAIDQDELRSQLFSYVALMGVTWLLDFPEILERKVPELAGLTDRYDPYFKSDESARNHLHILTVFLNAWRTYDLGDVLLRGIGKSAGRAHNVPR